MLHNIDALELLSSLADESIDMVLTDPPYFIGYDGGKGWDKQWKNEEEYLSWCKKWSAECVRVLKPGRMMIVFGTTKTDTFFKYKLEILNKLEPMKGQTEIVWSYDWGGRTKKNFALKHEIAWCYSKGKEFIFNADDIRIPYKMKENVRATANNNPLGKIPTAVWEKNNHTTSKEYVKWHPTQKPFLILERMIRAYTKPGETVLDIFSGSGSTMISCENVGRKFVGTELDKEYYEKSTERYLSFHPGSSTGTPSLTKTAQKKRPKPDKRNTIGSSELFDHGNDKC